MSLRNDSHECLRRMIAAFGVVAFAASAYARPPNERDLASRVNARLSKGRVVAVDAPLTERAVMPGNLHRGLDRIDRDLTDLAETTPLGLPIVTIEILNDEAITSGRFASGSAEAYVFYQPNDSGFGTFMKADDTAGLGTWSNQMIFGNGFQSGGQITGYELLVTVSQFAEGPASFEVELWDGDPFASIDTACSAGGVPAPIPGTTATFSDLPQATETCPPVPGGIEPTCVGLYRLRADLMAPVTINCDRVWMVATLADGCRAAWRSAGSGGTAWNEPAAIGSSDGFELSLACEQFTSCATASGYSAGTCCDTGSPCDHTDADPGNWTGDCAHATFCGDGVAEETLIFSEAPTEYYSLVGSVFTATDTTFSLVPVSSSDPEAVILGNEITIASGNTVTLEIHVAGWDPDLIGDPKLKLWQVAIDSSSYASGLQGTLTRYAPVCTTDPECVDALGVGAECNYPYDCSNPNCRCTPGFIDATRSDYVFASTPDIHAVDLVSVNNRFGAFVDTFSGGEPVSDPGIPQYGGTLALEVPANADGTFTVRLLPGSETFMSDEADDQIPLVGVEPALITIRGECGDNLRQGEEECDGTDDSACPGLCRDPGDPRECTCQGAEFLMVPVSSTDSGAVIVGNEITMAGGHTVTLEIQLAGWDPELDADPKLRSWQATVDSSGYTSGLHGSLSPYTPDCVVNDDCVFGSECDESDHCTAGFIDTTRTDYVFASLDALEILGLSTLDYLYAATVDFQDSVIDPGVARYGGTLLLQAPVTTEGTFTVGFLNGGLGPTLMGDPSNERIPLVRLTPALITVVTECGNNIREGSEECDGTDDAACPGECLPPDDPYGECTCPPPLEEIYWDNAAGGFFDVGGNWVGGEAPTRFDRPIFDLATGGYTVDFRENAETAELRVFDDVVTFDLGSFSYSLLDLAGVTGNLTIQNGTMSARSVAVLAGASSTLTVTGPASSLVADFVIVGNASGAGTLRIDNGAGASVAEYFGGGEGGAGDITVTDPGSSLTLGCEMVLGVVGGDVTMLLDSAATVTVTGTPDVCDGIVAVGEYGTGALTTQGGATLACDVVYIAIYPGSHGSAVVSGSGSSWTVADSAVFVGVQGDGALIVLNGGSVDSAGGGIAADEGSFGGVLVTGTGSSWTMTDELSVGVAGPATVEITSGGTVTSVGGTVGGGSSFLTHAASEGGASGSRQGASGSVTISGTGSEWQISGPLTVGVDAPGILAVTDSAGITDPDPMVVGGLGTVEVTAGGTIQTGSADIGYGSGTAEVTINGSGSSWDSSATVTIGVDGEGVLTVTDLAGKGNPDPLVVGGLGRVNVTAGGSLETGSADIGYGAGTAAVTVDGSGSYWWLYGPPSIGVDGPATVTVTDSGVLNGEGSPDPVDVGPLGHVAGDGLLVIDVLNRGLVQAGKTDPDPFAPGALTIDGDYVQETGGVLLVEIGGTTPETEHGQLVVTGTATLAGTLSIRLVEAFMPGLGNSFVIMTYASRTGDFNTISGAVLGNGTSLKPTAGPTSVMLNTILDCNENLVDDADDILSGTSTDCQLDGIPDECEIQWTSSAPGGPFFCRSGCDADCNVNGVPDACESPSCCNWPGGEGNLSSAGCDPPDSFVTTGGGSIVNVDGNATFQTILLEGSTFNLTNGNVTTTAAGGIFNQGIIQVDGDKVLDASAGDVSIASGGSYQRVPVPGSRAGCDLGVDVCAELQADDLVVYPGSCPDSDGGRINLADAMLARVSGRLVLVGSPDPYCTASGSSSRGITPPPKLWMAHSTRAGIGQFAAVAAASKPRLSASFVMTDGVDTINSSTVGMLLAGDFDNRSTYPSLFNWSSGRLALNGSAGAQTFEVAGLDLGPVAEGFWTSQDTLFDTQTHMNYSIGMLEVASGTHVRFVNNFANTTGTGACQEVLYVDTLTLQSGSTITLDNARVYYNTLQDYGATINMTGCGEIRAICDSAADGDDCQTAAIPATEGAYVFDTTCATTDGPDEPDACDFGGYTHVRPDVWFCYTSSCYGTATVSLCDSGYDTKLAVYAGCTCPWEASAMACNEDACGVGGLRSEVSFAANAGGRYLIRIGGSDGATGPGTLEITCRECTPSSPPVPPSGEPGYEKIRYISMVPGNPGQQTALRVTFTNLPPPFAGFNGIRCWVGEPQTVSENAGKISHQSGWPDFMSANLDGVPYCMDWSTVGVIHVTDDDIIPGAVYDIQAVDCDCDLDNEADYSAPLTITTSRWGDLVGTCAIIPCTPPNGVVGIPTDVTACLDKFKNLANAVIKSRADIEPNFPDWLVNISDVTFVLDAFRGFAYPPAQTPPAAGWPGPGGCP